MKTSDQIDKISPALAKSFASVENVSKDAKNEFFKKPNGKASTYATLAAVLDAVRTILAANCLAVIQDSAFDPEHKTVSVTTRLLHESGQWIESTASAIPAKCDAQGIGAVTTYLRRYALAAMCGVAQEDDDGNSARHEDEPPRQEPRAAPQNRANGKQAPVPASPAKEAADAKIGDNLAKRCFEVVEAYAPPADVEAWPDLDRADRNSVYRRACAAAKAQDPEFVPPV